MAVDHNHSDPPAGFGWFAVEILDIPDTAADVILLRNYDTHIAECGGPSRTGNELEVWDCW
jgi:hypothetical protein